MPAERSRECLQNNSISDKNHCNPGQPFFISGIRSLIRRTHGYRRSCKICKRKPGNLRCNNRRDQPHVRAFADNTGFCCHTGTPKSVCQQVRKNPEADLWFHAPGAQGAGRMMRITGKVGFPWEKSPEERLSGERPRVKDLLKSAPKDARPGMFRTARGQAHFRTMENTMREREAPRVKF